MRKYLYAREMLLTISSANLTRLLCQWPCCKNSASFSFVGTEALHEHYRSVHDTHDFSWSCLLPCQSILSHSGAGIAQRIQSDGTATSLRSGQPSSSGVPSTRDVAELGFILKCSEKDIYFSNNVIQRDAMHGRQSPISASPESSHAHKKSPRSVYGEPSAVDCRAPSTSSTHRSMLPEPSPEPSVASPR